MKLRINKLLSDAGLGSRREVEELIRQGRVLVNGQRATLSSSVGAEDEVLFDDVDLPVKDLVREHAALEKVVQHERHKTESRQGRPGRGKSAERAESQRILATPKSAALRKTSKNNPENKRLHKLREAAMYDEDEAFSFAREPKGMKREQSRQAGPRKVFTKKAR